MKSIKNANLRNKHVVLRVDFNVPIEKGKVTDDARINEVLSTISYILEKGGSVIIISHLGRPGGKKVSALSLAPVAKKLEKLLGKKVEFLTETVGAKAREKASALKPGQIMMLENLRFSPYEELNDRAFAEKLAGLGNIFVQEAFSNAHHAHASMVAITDYLPSYAGLHFAKEYEMLSDILNEPKKPFVFIAGGKKTETKVEALRGISQKADIILLGGGLANTFLMAEGYEVGRSFYEEEYVSDAEQALRDAFDSGCEVLLPQDVMVARNISKDTKEKEKDIEQIEADDIIADIGPKTISKYAQPIKFAGTIVWNGPLGIFEYKSFQAGTRGVASLIQESHAVAVVGGGDTLAALKELNIKEDFTYVSTAGGAMMEFLAGNKMPGVEALK